MRSSSTATMQSNPQLTHALLQLHHPLFKTWPCGSSEIRHALDMFVHALHSTACAHFIIKSKFSLLCFEIRMKFTCDALGLHAHLQPRPVCVLYLNVCVNTWTSECLILWIVAQTFVAHIYTEVQLVLGDVYYVHSRGGEVSGQCWICAICDAVQEMGVRAVGAVCDA